MPLPIAMYSNSLVGDPKKGVPSLFGDVRRRQDVARRQIDRALRLRHDAGQDREIADVRSVERRHDLRHPHAVTDHQQPDRFAIGGCRAISRPNARASTSAPCHGPNVPMKPMTILPSRPSRARTAGAVDVRRIAIGLDAVGIHEDLAAPTPRARSARRPSAG